MADKVDAQVQEKSVDLKLDNTAPVINSVAVEGLKIEVDATDDFAGLRTIYYADKFGAAELVKKDDKYTYTLFSAEDIDNGKIIAIDWAGNRTEQLVKEASGKGSLSINWISEDDSPKPTNKLNVYRIVEGKDGKEDQIAVSDLSRLQLGKYKVAFDTLPADYEYKIEPEDFEITEENLEQTVTITYKKVDTKDFGELRIDLLYPADYKGRVDVFAVDENGKAYPISTRVATFGSYLMAKVPAGEYEIVAKDQSGNPVQLIGPRTLEVASQKVTRQKYQVLFRAFSYMFQLYAYTDDVKLYDEICKAITVKTYEDENGKTQEYYPFDIQKWFDITNAETGTSIYDQDFDLPYTWKDAERTWDGQTKDGNYEVDIIVSLPAGKYKIEFKGDTSKYNIDPQVIEQSAYNPRQFNEKNPMPWKGFKIYTKSETRGSLTVTEELLAGVKEQAINSVYTLYNSYGELVDSTTEKTWENLPLGKYTLEIESQIPELTPERTSYSISITEENLDVSQLVRYKNLAEDPIERMAGLNIGAYGSYPDYLENLEVKLTSKKDGKTYREKVQLASNKTIGKQSKILLPMGTYEVEFTNLPEGCVIEGLFLSTFNWYDRSDLLNEDGNKFELLVNNSNVEVELSLNMTYFSPEKVTINFDSNGGSQVEAIETEKGKVAEKPADPTRQGLTFVGWFLDGEEFDFSSPVNEDITLKAKWSMKAAELEPIEPEKPVEPVKPAYPPYSPILDWIWYGPTTSPVEPTSPARDKTPVISKSVDLEVKLTIGSKTNEVTMDDIVTKIEMDVEPYIKDGRTMLPIRYVAEALGFEVEWVEATRTVILKDKEFKIEIPVNTNKIIVNGETYESDVKPEIVKDRTMLPIANIARALGLVDGEDIIWNETNREVIIKRQVKF